MNKNSEHILQKTHPKSTIDTLLPGSMHYFNILNKSENDNGERIIILQIADIKSILMVEYVKEKDYDDTLVVSNEKTQSSTIYINSVLTKSHPNSIMQYFSPKDRDFRELFSKNSLCEEKIVILQVLNLGEYVIVEYVLEEYFKTQIKKEAKQ